MSSLALYRTYRPGRFADVVGQDHVTGPLTRALANDRVHHAYLFSGPRGCGKTSSARILARSLNCDKGPTAEPCGECRSCVDLAPNGPGSIDVVELDAATHGLVDDARELREKAHFAPVSSRYKIYIIDEAHQLGPGAANALLKLIEEPPAHLKFIFATTAPDKIIGTIRSRTHHYPFRLIPARTLQENLARICELEVVAIEQPALALVARAAGGSARDGQSILGQLIAGSGDDGVTYDLAVALLGFTDAAQLDEVVDAIGRQDGATVFAAVDRVVDSGHDPRRFLTDLMERFRDLIVLRAAPDASSSGLISIPPEDAQQLARQAESFGPADLVRLADVVDDGITAMKGATPTRLQLELVCARLLLPGADRSVDALQARLDRLERRIALGIGQPAQPSASAPAATAAAPSTAGEAPGREAISEPTAQTPHRSVAAAPALQAVAGSGSSAPSAAAAPAQAATPSQGAAPASPAVAAASSGHSTHAPPHQGGTSGYGLADVRKLWPEVLDRLREIKRTPWSLISQQSAVTDFADGVLTLAFKQPALRDTFARRDDFQANLRQAIKDVLQIEVRFEAIVDPSIEGNPGPGATGSHSSGNAPANPGASANSSNPTQPGAPGSPGAPASQDAQVKPGVAATPSTPADSHRPGGPGGTSTPTTAGSTSVSALPTENPQATTPPANKVGPPVAQSSTTAAAPPRLRASQPTTPATAAHPAGRDPHKDHDAHPDDEDLDISGVSHQQLLEQTLGAQVIEEIDH